MKKIYIVSGPLGVGKSSVARELANKLHDCALIEGDLVYNLEEESELEWDYKLQNAWQRIVVATKKALSTNTSVVLDFVVEDELQWFLGQIGPEIETYYIVLMADQETIRRRLIERKEIKYLGRALELIGKLKNDSKNLNYIIDTNAVGVVEIVNTILSSERFKFKSAE